MGIKTQISTTLFSLFAFTHISEARTFLFAGQDFAPFIFEEKGEIAGSIVDIMKEACKELKYSCKFEISPSARANNSLVDGTIDGLLAVTKNKERDAIGSFGTTPFAPIKKVYLAKVEDKIPQAKTLNDLAGLTAVTIRATVNSKLLFKHAEEVKTLKPVEETDYPTIVQRLKNKQYGPKTIVLGADDVVKYYGSKENIKLESIYVIDEANYGMYFSKTKVSADELAAFNKTLATLSSNGTFKKILDKYTAK